MRRHPVCNFLGTLLLIAPLYAQTSAQRPRVLGIAHVAFRSSDINKTAVFYKSLLGYAEPFSLGGESGQSAIKFLKVNDQQYVELFQGDSGSQGQLDHFALYTNDLAAMKR